MHSQLSLTVWRLRSGADRRFRSGHPWVYSNELLESPKGIEPGAPVELRDAGGKFLARGYGNPHSLIAFRKGPSSSDEVFAALEQAKRLRQTLGLSETSYRLCFGEADGLPGLVIDRYRIEDSWAFVIQAHTAGAQNWLPELPNLLERLFPGEKHAIVLRNDIGVRKLEGLTEEEPRVLKEIAGTRLSETKIKVAAVAQGAPLEFQVNLVKGQKTGFFLDQAANIQLAALRFSHLKPDGASLKILDLCCYVGQWSAQLARLFKNKGMSVDVLAVDASAQALSLAKMNIEAQGARCEILKADVLKGLDSLPEHSFDIVISDPPALIQGRKDIPVGTHAYLQLNTQVFRLVKRSGAVVSCSCSALLEEESFCKVLAKAARRNGAEVSWVARGTQAPDHPMRVEFPEGRYLKCWIGMAH